MSSDRRCVREALATLLNTELAGIVKEVTAAKVTSLSGRCPLVVVLGGGTLRERFTGQGDKPTFSLEVQVWVPQARGDTWTNTDAENKLDEIEAAIAQVYETYRNSADWDTIEYSGFSTVGELSIKGDTFYLERIPTLVRLQRN